MRVGILGPLQAVADGKTVEIGGVRLRALLIRLALDAGRTVTVNSLSQALWPDDRPADPANALHTLVSRLRRALSGLPGGGPALRSAAGGYCLDLVPDAVDALRFERLAREGRRALRAGEAEAAADRLREALGLWRGEALADVAAVPFAAAAAARLEELRLAATEDRAEAELRSAPEYGQLVAELEQLTTAHPLRERLRVLLVRALHADGRQAEALTAYEEYRRLLVDELGADPGPELRDAHLAVLRGQNASIRSEAEGRSGTRPRGNLRASLTSFVGRAEERTRIGKQLTEGRLVTLVGAGGAGKTRLATTLAAELADGVPGGVWLVELAPVTHPDGVPQAVIGALGLREVGAPTAPAAPRDARTRLAEALAATETLLVLDNCEHLVDAVARLVDELLGRCPRLRVLTTSREPLGILGEALYPVPPLDLPEPQAPPAEAATFPAVQMFLDRAAAARPDFTLDDGNVAAVVEVCRRLDGLPLAIELAAARLRSLPVEQLATRLGDRFRLLTGGSRTALPRHRTLRAVVDWSWDLLDGDERRLARRLAVFPATITPESAGQVCAPVPAVLDTLAALVDKSMLQVVDDGPEPRYRMLETIREYGLERLAETGETARVRAAHAGYFLDLAERAEPHLRGPGQLPWINRLAAERDNLAAALRFAADEGDVRTAVRLAAALGLFWTVQGNHAEAAGWLRRALELPGDGPTEARAVATAFYLFNTVLAGGHGRGQGIPGEPRPPAAGVGLEKEHPACALVEPALALFADDTVEGPALIDRRLSHPDPWTRAMLRLIRSLLHGNSGDMDEMRRDLAAAVAAFRQAGERWGLATSLTYLAYTHNVLGYFDDAIAALEESTRLLRELDAGDLAVLQRAWIADARRRMGDLPGARAELVEMVGQGARPSTASHLLFARITLGDLARYDGDLQEAARQYDAVAGDLRRVPSQAPLFRAMLGAALGQLAVARNEPAVAQRHLADALALAVEAPDLPLVAVVAVGVARLRLGHAAAHEAAEVLGAAHLLRGAPDPFNPDVARLTHELRAELGDRAFEAAYSRGSGLDRAGAVALIQAQVRRR